MLARISLRVVVAITCVVCVSGLAWSQNPPVAPARIEGTGVAFEPMSRVFIDRFFDSVRGKSAFDPGPLTPSSVVDSNTAIIWAGTKEEIQTTLSEIVLRFRPSAEARLERANQSKKQVLSSLADELEVRIFWDKEGFHIVHPLSESKAFRRGLVVAVEPLRRAQARTQYFEGVRDSGMYLSLPSMIQSEVEKAWGVLLCPRVVAMTDPKRGPRAGLELRRSPYELSEVKMTWAGRAWANIPFGTKKEKVGIDLAVSSALPSSLSFHDEIVAMSPVLNLVYQPTEVFDFVRFPQDGQLREGILFSVTMQNSAGYRRVQRFGHIGYIQRIDEPSPVPIILGDQVASRDEGSCYIIGGQRGMWAEYSRGDPIAP